MGVYKLTNRKHMTSKGCTNTGAPKSNTKNRNDKMWFGVSHLKNRSFIKTDIGKKAGQGDH